MEMTIEQYAEFISSLMQQAEEQGFDYGVDLSEIKLSGKPLSEKAIGSDQATG